MPTSSDLAISVRSLSKLYAIGEKRQGYRTLRESLSSLFSRRASKNGHAGDGAAPKTFWALRDVSFDVRRGEIVGIIGRNGAGKSTLLKILSRITDPTSGEVEISGRAGSLLEVGTGFHPELTGRENIFLNGAILGMKRAEITARFDEIVSFAGTEQFLDTPVKHYSSGMYMRLAFAIAAHLEPEILIVDEVLAVGDAEFQKKCLGKMGDFSHSGRTVLFVSHNMAAVNSLCKRCILLESGSIVTDGPTEKVTGLYHAQFAEAVWGQSDLRAAPRTGNGEARFTSMTVQPVAPDSSPLDAAYTGCDLDIKLIIEASQDISNANVSLIIWDRSGYRLTNVNTWKKGRLLDLLAGDRACIRFRVRELLLLPGSYVIGLWIGHERVDAIDYIEQAASIDVVPNPADNKSPMEFSGPYLCRFDQDISVLPNRESSEDILQASDVEI